MQTDRKEHLPRKFSRISGVDTRKCMKCGKCSGTCPAFHEMDIHPHQFVSMVEKGDIDGLDEIQITLDMPLLLCVR